MHARTHHPFPNSTVYRIVRRSLGIQKPHGDEVELIRDWNTSPIQFPNWAHFSFFWVVLLLLLQSFHTALEYYTKCPNIYISHIFPGRSAWPACPTDECWHSTAVGVIELNKMGGHMDGWTDDIHTRDKCLLLYTHWGDYKHGWGVGWGYLIIFSKGREFSACTRARLCVLTYGWAVPKTPERINFIYIYILEGGCCHAAATKKVDYTVNLSPELKLMTFYGGRCDRIE